MRTGALILLGTRDVGSRFATKVRVREGAFGRQRGVIVEVHHPGSDPGPARERAQRPVRALRTGDRRMTYSPAEGTYIGRPPCANCGANFHLHRLRASGPAVSGATLANAHERGEALVCPTERPEPARAETLDAARAELAQAEASKDPQRVFVARGNVQRLMRAASEFATVERANHAGLRSGETTAFDDLMRAEHAHCEHPAWCAVTGDGDPEAAPMGGWEPRS